MQRPSWLFQSEVIEPGAAIPSMNILKPSFLAVYLLALSGCAPLSPARPYYGARQVVVLEQWPEVHRVYPLMRDKYYPAGTAYYEDQFGCWVAVCPDPEEFHRHR